MSPSGAQVTLQQLAYVVALADHRHFGRAATACHVSQPGLSTQIREVEKRLGALLFERSTRGVLVTPAGEEVVRRAREVLRSVDDLVDAAQVDGSELQGPLHLGIIPTLGPYLLPSVVATVTKRFPAVHLFLAEVRTDDLLERLRDGQLDVGVMATVPDGDDLAWVQLGSDPFHVAVGAGHPLATASAATVSFADLAPYKVILLEEGHCMREQAGEACAVGDLHTHEVQATSLPSLVQMVAAGVGITLLPVTAAALEGRPGNGIVVRRLRPPVPERPVIIVWRASSPRALALRELARLLRPVLGLKRPRAASGD